jgi:hypothetical protein
MKIVFPSPVQRHVRKQRHRIALKPAMHFDFHFLHDFGFVCLIRNHQIRRGKTSGVNRSLILDEIPPHVLFDVAKELTNELIARCNEPIGSKQ